MAQTREEAAAQAAKDNTEANEKYAKEQREWAEKSRGEQPDQAETESEYYARIQAARATGIFGDLDTSVGAENQVPSADNEAATVAVAEKDAAAEEGDDEAADASDNEARRQVDASAGTTGFADEVDEAADDQNEDHDSDEKHEDEPVV